jgi:hypothetical protein
MRGRSIAGALLAVLISSSASAQPMRWSFKLGGGLAVPTGSYNTYVKEGWQGQLGAGYFPRGGKFGLSAEFNRSSTGIDQHFLDSLGATEGSSRLWRKGGAVFLEGRYHHAFADPVDSQVLPIVVGVTFGF